MLPKGAKIIGISSIVFIDKTGKRKTINTKSVSAVSRNEARIFSSAASFILSRRRSAEKEKKLFEELNAIIKNAEKNKTLWKKNERH